MEISLDNGKYKVIMTDDVSAFYALRNNENWRDLLGDNLIYFMALEIKKLKDQLDKSNKSCDTCISFDGVGCRNTINCDDTLSGWIEK